MSFPISREEGLEILLRGTDGPIPSAVNPPEIDRLQRLLGRLLQGCDPRTCYDIARAIRESRLSEGVLNTVGVFEDYEEPHDLEGEIEAFLNGLPLLREGSQALTAAAQHALASMDWPGLLETMQPERISHQVIIHSGAVFFERSRDKVSSTLVLHELSFTSWGVKSEEALVKTLINCQIAFPALALL
jgi:hypothetical protein